MTASFGKSSEPLTSPAAATTTATMPTSPAALSKKHYRKPALKRLGLLRSVTGSDIVF